MLERIVTDFNPARVLCAGTQAAALAPALRECGVEVKLLAELLAAPAELAGALAGPRCDLSLCLGRFVPSDAAAGATEQALDAISHSNNIVFAMSPEWAWDAPGAQTYWILQFAQRSFYRDVDYEAAPLAAGALCLRRLVGSNLPVIAAYERALVQRERELAAQRLVTMEYRDALLDSDLQVEALHQSNSLGALGLELLALRSRLAPAGTRRGRYFDAALGGLHKASHAARYGLERGEQLVRGSKSLLRGPSR